MMPPVKFWRLNLWSTRVSGPMQAYASVISTNMGFQKPSTRIASVFFRVNHTNVTTTAAQTMFEQAMGALGIELICAYSPQAKGRVERANQTLQDRLVKEMRLAGISDYQQANVFLTTYIPSYNQKFAVQPADRIDSHEPLRAENDLEWIFNKKDSAETLQGSTISI